MRLPILTIGLLILFGLTIQAQTTITGVVSDSLNVPIASASVYLSKTTLGTLTDRKGIYLLSVPERGVYEMTVSFIGFKTVSLLINAEGSKQTINIKLSVNPVLLKEITVKSKEKNRLQNYSRFVKLFLGETSNSQYCKIMNSADLRLFTDTQTNTLNGFSYKPLRIENRALGYIINYDLKDFSYNTETGFLKFEGNYFFQPLKGTSREAKKWVRNRLSAYYGSRMHLFRALFSDSLSREDYKIFECKTDSLKKELQIIKQIQVNDLRLSQRNNYLTLFHNKPILIDYTDNHSELSIGLTGFQSKKEISTLKFSDFINVYKNGFFDNPYSVTWGGEMSNERVADMLPYDFMPDENKIIEPYSDSDISPIEKYLMSQQNNYSRDQVFVHTDRNMYSPGDTIRFQTFIRDRYTNVFGSTSASLYALLFNDRNIVVDSSRFKIEKSTSSGWMTIPDNAQTGKYHFAAFTGKMENYDPADAFQLDIYVKEKAKNQVKAETKAEVMVEGNNKNNLTEITTSADTCFELRFLPEGGTLIAGLEQRIGFNATDSKGEPVTIKGLLKDRNGSVKDTIESGPFGPGLLICTPEPGMYVELINKNGIENKWLLPEPAKTGISLSVKPVDRRSFAVEIQSNDYNSDTITVAGIMNTTYVFSQELQLNKKQRIIVKTDELLSGVAQITLFNKELKPLAERLFYINPDKHLVFNIRTDKDVYDSGQETTLAVSVCDGQGNPAEGIFSLAIADSVSGHNAGLFSPGIEYTYNYNPWFQENLPPEVRVKGLENLSNNDLDLLLMVYGWSRYNWNFKTVNTIDTEVKDYELLKMKILHVLKSRRADRRLDLISLEGPSVMHLVTNNLGEISLPLDSLPEITRSITMIPDVKNKKRVTGAMFSIPYNEKFFKSSKLNIPQPVIPIEVYRKAPADKDFVFDGDVIPIEEVVIKGHPEYKKVYHDKYEEMYQYAYIKSLDYNLLWTSFSVDDAVSRLIVPYRMTNEYIILFPPHSFFGASIPALVVQDGMPIYNDGWQWAHSIQPSEMTSLTILKGKQAAALYGLAASGGVIFINTRSNDPNFMKIRTDWKLQHNKDKMLLPISIYRPDKEFYKPAKFDIEKDPEIQSRSTIYWDSEVYFNGKEPVKIKYLNLKHHGPVIITINGASVNNLVGTGRAKYMVN